MPGTIRDDISAKSKVLAENAGEEKSGSGLMLPFGPELTAERLTALSVPKGIKNPAELTVTYGRSNVGAPRFGKISRTKNHFSNEIRPAAPGFKNSFLRKALITSLAIAALIGLSNKVNATYVHFDCTYPTHTKCCGVFRTCDSDAFVDGSICTGGPQRPPAGWYGNWYGHFNTGDNIDTWWYHYLDEGRYYYLDIAKYKLLGGARHTRYPNLFEKSMDREVGFISRRRIHWFGGLWTHRFISKPIWLSNTTGYPCDNVCMLYDGPLPISNYVIWGCCFNTGDDIDKWRYDYLDKGRYYFLDDTRYRLLGRRAYPVGSLHSRYWYPYDYPDTYGFPCHYDSPYACDLRCPLTDSMKENIKANIPCNAAPIICEPAIPEPATIGFLGLGGLGLLISRNKKSRTY